LPLRIWATSRTHFGNYAFGFYAFAAILTFSAIVFTRLPRYTYTAGSDPNAAA